MKEYSVTEINTHIKSVIADDFALRNICIKGEISNCKYHTNGHIYFTLKDERSAIRAVMWKSVPRPDFRLEDGLEILVQGQVSVYEFGGYYQVNVREVKRSGLGELYLKLDMLKKMYSEMGYFAPQYKKKISPFSTRIGVVTAKTGAAIRDIYHLAVDKNPYVEIVLYNALVQGTGAAESIVRGIETLDKKGLDVIIIGRGGGSIEDLWAFNEEIVAEAVFACETPVVSAVGHETDDTITDLIADVRAATPSDAARIAVCDINAVFEHLLRYRTTLKTFALKKAEDLKQKLNSYGLKLSLNSPRHRLDKKKLALSESQRKLDELLRTRCERCRFDLKSRSLRLTSVMNTVLEKERFRLRNAVSKLELLSPLKSLSRGYGYLETTDGHRVSGIDDIREDEIVKIYFTDGHAKALIKEKIYGTEGSVGEQLQKT